MNKQVTPPKKKSVLVPIVIAASVIFVGCAIFLLMNHAQQSDPTLTAAPPPGPSAVTLYPSPGKAAKLEAEGAMMRAKMGGPPGGSSASASESSANQMREQRLAMNSKLPEKVREHLSTTSTPASTSPSGAAALPGAIEAPQ